MKPKSGAMRCWRKKIAQSPDVAWNEAAQRARQSPAAGSARTTEFHQEIDLQMHKGEVGIPWKETEAPGQIINKGKPRKTPDPL